MLRRSDRAPGLVADDDVVLPHDVEIGANVVIHAGVELGAAVRIQDGAVVGKPVVLARTSQAELRPTERTSIGEGVTIAAQAVVVAGAGRVSGPARAEDPQRSRVRVRTPRSLV